MNCNFEELRILRNFVAVNKYITIIEMEIIRTVEQLKNRLSEEKVLGHTLGLVPTMGALHAGHISLIDKARKENDIIVVSVFVNPTQFNNPEDLRTYPRTENADCEKLNQSGVDYAFIPSVEDIYPEPDTRVFDLGAVADVMEGPMRPGHFNGVAQIVSKLFSIVKPHRAYFGEKDFQQIAVIRRMVELEAFNIDIIACPIKREEDGLAMSSRNVRLTTEQRAIAPIIYHTLSNSQQYAANHNVEDTKKYVIDTLNAIKQLSVEYFEIVNASTMQPIKCWDDTEIAVGCITVYCGEVRLIDNIKYYK